MLYVIPQANREDVEKLIARFQKKANQYGQTLICKLGDPYAREVDVLERDGNQVNPVGKMMVEVFDLEIDSEGLIRKDGYSVIAMIEHYDSGNIVRTFTDEFDDKWSTMKAHCDHCNGNHGQRVTYIVRHEDGTEKQVGRTCLKDYCGLDPQMIGRCNELTCILLSDDVDHYEFPAGRVPRVYNALEALALAERIHKHYGYVQSCEENSNKSRLAELILGEHPTDSELAHAKEMADVILGAEDLRGSLLIDIRNLLRSGYCKASHFGYMAYAPVAYERYMNQLRITREREAKTMAERESSGYVGEIGKRIIVDIASMELLTSYDNEWGTTYLYKIIDTSGNVMIWYASGRMKDADDVKRLKVTIKNYGERNGVKQTIVTRCCAA